MEKKDILSSLPDEILMHVLFFVDKDAKTLQVLMCVNSYFKQLACDAICDRRFEGMDLRLLFRAEWIKDVPKWGDFFQEHTDRVLQALSLEEGKDICQLAKTDKERAAQLLMRRVKISTFLANKIYDSKNLKNEAQNLIFECMFPPEQNLKKHDEQERGRRVVVQIKALVAIGIKPDLHHWLNNYWLNFNEDVELLLEAGAEVNSTNDSGQTPLHRVAMCNKIGFVELFLKAGADPHARDNEGKTPLDIAEGSSDKACYNLMLQDKK